MHSNTSILGRAIFALLILFTVLLVPVRPVAAQHGCDAGNLIPNCNFDVFSGSPPRQVPEGWTPFVLSGDLTFMQHTDTYWGAPSLMMWSNGGTFVAGIWTQVGGLQPGATYKASVGWGAPNAPDAFGRRLGIDPTGGTDPNSPNIVWGPIHYGPGRSLNYPPPDVNIDVAAVAQSGTVTVFFYVDHNYSTGDNYIFVDAVSLFADSSQPVVQPTAIPPTAVPPTAVPPTPAPALKAAAEGASALPVAAAQAPRLQASATPTATATSTATEVPTATATPTETPTPTVTATPTHTLTPTATATSTLPPRPTATAGPRQTVTQTSADDRQPFLLGGLGALGGAGLLGLVTILMRRRVF